MWRSTGHSRKITRTAVCTALVFALGLAARLATASDFEALTADELRVLVPDSDVYQAGEILRTQPTDMKWAFKRDGTVLGTQTDPELVREDNDSGKWWVENDRLCLQWRIWADGETQCYQIRRTGEEFWSYDSDDRRSWELQVDGRSMARLQERRSQPRPAPRQPLKEVRARPGAPPAKGAGEGLPANPASGTYRDAEGRECRDFKRTFALANGGSEDRIIRMCRNSDDGSWVVSN